MSDREFDNINGIKVCDQTARNSIPTKTSQLENDSDYATITQVNQAINNAQLGGGEVDLSGYVTKETGNANQITFADGQTFQAKLDNGTLKGDKGDPGEQGEIGQQGPKGDKGADGVTTSIVVNGNTYTHVDGVITLPNYPTNVSGGEIVAGGGLTSTAQTLLISILRSAVFTSDQSTNIALLQSELAKGNSGGGSETTQYVITNTLNNATTSNSIALVDANSSYTATITVNEGYTLDTITVTMGGTDITNTAVSGTTITISAVTGNVVITVTTTESGSSSGGGMVTDGLENYFDFRTATYNNEGAGGSTIISATQGNGSLYTWAKNMVTEQGDYGIAIGRNLFYNANSVGTTSTPSGTSFTWIFKCYITSLGSPLFHNGYGGPSNIAKMGYSPKYKTASGTSKAAIVGLGEKLASGYDTVTLIVDGNICKLYFGTKLMQTNDGSTIDGFQSWYNVLEGVVMLSAKGYLTQMAIYNKALSEVELVDMIDYLTTLEVK